jgi:hypothetical protein
MRATRQENLRAARRRDLDQELDRAVCKGVNKLEPTWMELTFERNGRALDLRIEVDRGELVHTLKRRT